MKKIHIISFLSFGVFGLVACNNNPSPTPPTPPATITHWYEASDWWKYCSNVGSEQAVKEDIGREVNLTINGIEHKIRLIGIDEDVDSNNNKIHCTFEFSNLLSDSNGRSLAIQWNDTNFTGQANNYYSKSTIHTALNGVGLSSVHWAQKGDSAWSQNYKLSVFDMLPSDLSKVLKAPKKIVNEVDGNTWDEKTYCDKLFLLTPKELGYTYPNYQEMNTVTYTYYSGCSKDRRVKKQVLENEYPDTFPAINGGVAPSYTGNVTNYAGINNNNPGYGGSYFLRSPCYDSDKKAWRVDVDGSTSTSNATQVYDNAYPIAPAFCI